MKPPSRLNLLERVEFWKRHPLVGDIPVTFPCKHKQFLMYSNNDDTVLKTLYWEGFFSGWEPTSLRLWSALSVGAAQVLDVGAYTGIYGLLASTSMSRGQVHCFEAARSNFERLQHNVRLNALEDRIAGVHGAVCAKGGQTTLYERYAAPDILSSIHSLNPERGVPVKVPSLTLDGYAQKHAISRVDLIKIDAEGAEPDVLAGGRGILSRDEPEVLVEANSAKELQRSWGQFPGTYNCFEIYECDQKIRRVSKSACGRVGGVFSRLVRRVRGSKSGRNFIFSARLSELELNKISLLYS